MYSELVKDKVYYKIFDKTYKQSTHIYVKYKANEATKITEINSNIKAIKDKFLVDNILILQQVHGNIVVDADMIDNFDIEPVADASVTTKKNLMLAVQTADCVPVLFSSFDGKIVGAAHAGWKSAKADIIFNVVKIMKDKGAQKIKAVVGPCIDQNSYEVDQNYYENFINEQAGYSKFFIPSIKVKHYMFNLADFVIMKLSEVGIEEIIKTDEDTYSLPEKYPSYRRSCHTQEVYNQNILSAIVIKND
jgi:YfiH family protein